MTMNSFINPPALSNKNTLGTLIENKTTFTINSCELVLYETHDKAKNVHLLFNDFCFTSMLRGRKEMYINNKTEMFSYLPGESLIVLPGEEMVIDFPEADDTPSQCLALSIDSNFIKQNIDYLNDKLPKEEGSWNIKENLYYLLNSQSLASATQNIIRIMAENNPAKEIMADLALKELFVRLMQTQARQYFENAYKENTNNTKFSFVINYIKENLHKKINIDKLANITYMSKPTFYRAFKQEFGITPNEFILSERISKAKRLLTKLESISQAAFEAGFSDTNYFIKVFKQLEGITPKAFQRTLAVQ